MGRGGEGAIAPTPKRRIFELLCHASDSLSLFLPLPLSPPPPSFELFVENETALPAAPLLDTVQLVQSYLRLY